MITFGVRVGFGIGNRQRESGLGLDFEAGGGVVFGAGIRS
jgi:hypothetical protein